MTYSLRLVDFPCVCFIDKHIDIKVAIVHNQSGGIGREKGTPFQLNVAYRNDSESSLVWLSIYYISTMKIIADVRGYWRTSDLSQWNSNSPVVLS